MKPNFEEMSTKELRAYVLAHRDDLTALDILVNRRSSDSEAIIFHHPKNKKEEKQQFELFKRIVEKKEGQKNFES